MTLPPIPVVLEPLCKAKPWGGRRLEALFGKRLPAGERIGETWELSDLPGGEVRVARGPLAGGTLRELVFAWGEALIPAADLVDGRLPLLVKFLDANEHLSVQVHPRPDGPDAVCPGVVKHEAWYVVHAEPAARLYAGLKDGVQPDDVRRAANTPALVELLRAWPARVGECYYLPSGTPHALGAGLVVAEVQTPSDVTFRLYDWGRVCLDGRPRELHVAQALENVRYDVPADVIRPAMDATRLAACERFVIHRRGASPGCGTTRPTLSVWIVMAGRGAWRDEAGGGVIGPGDVALLPPSERGFDVTWQTEAEWLEVTLPVSAK